LLVLFFTVITAAAQNTTPQIFARFQLTGRSGRLLPTTIYTPTQAGMYRASCFIIDSRRRHLERLLHTGIRLQLRG
jgi:hypothetical protein